MLLVLAFLPCDTTQETKVLSFLPKLVSYISLHVTWLQVAPILLVPMLKCIKQPDFQGGGFTEACH